MNYLTKSQIKDIFSYYCGANVFPKSSSKYFENLTTGNQFYDTKSAIDCASLGDEIYVSAYQALGGYEYGSKRFMVEYHDYIKEAIEQEKEWNRKFRKRDYQRQKVYDFEYFMIRQIPKEYNYKIETEQDVIKLYQYIYALLGINKSTLPMVEITRKNKRTSSHRSYVIKLAHGWGQALKVALHELAHDIVGTMLDNEENVAHGKTFVSVTLALYEYFIPSWNKDLAFSELHNRKIKWSEADYQKMIDALSGKQQLTVSEKLSVNRSVALSEFINHA